MAHVEGQTSQVSIHKVDENGVKTSYNDETLNLGTSKKELE
ncbi:hypothetical protein Hanom_Chr09g00771251 [Helianthus anomalus]